MDAFFNNISHRKTKVAILATYALVRSSLQSLLEADLQLSVLDTVGTFSELIEKVSHNNPDVVLICLAENEDENIVSITDLRKAAPETKVVILSSPNNSLSPAVLKLGAAAIIGANQSARTLVRAIRQVSAGEIWLNQKLITQLLDDGFNSSSKSKYKSKEYSKSDNLTKRELEVVRMIGLGLTNKDISKNYI